MIPIFVLVLAMMCLTPSFTSGQLRTAEIVGAVSDATGGRVPGTTVTARNLGSNDERHATTDNRGNYLITLLPPGQYSISVQLPGFKRWSVPHVTLAAGDRLALDPVLELGAEEVTVEVTAVAPALQTSSSTLGTLVDSEAMQSLPLNGRNFIVLAQLAPGANDSTIGFGGGNGPDDRRLTSQVAINGQYAWANNFMIDGMDNNERSIGTIIVKPSVEAIREMKIQTNLYSAELGRTAGGAINLITKSGTNDFDGSLYNFFRNERLDARNFFASEKAPYRQNQVGGSLGGPILRNRTFFFADYEALRIEQGMTFTSTVPTLAMRQGNFAGVARLFDPLTTNCVGTNCTRAEFPDGRIPADRLNPIAVRLVNLYPEPTSGGLANNFTNSPSQTLNQDTFDVRLDHRVSEISSFFVRYSFTDTRSFLPPAIPIGDAGLGGTTNQRTHGAQTNFVRTFGARAVMEIRGGYSRFDIDSLSYNPGENLADDIGIKNANVDFRTSGLPRFLPAGYRSIGDGSFLPLFNTNNVYQIGGSITHQQGAHSIKYGAELRKREVNLWESPSPRGAFNFNPTLTVDNPLSPTARTGHPIASLLLGYPFTVSRSILIIDPQYRYLETGAYLQDDWRVRPWLTVNVGARYDYYSPMTEAENRLSNVDLSTGRIVIAGQDGISQSVGVQKDWINLAPRLGVAAILSEGTVLRGGYGVSFVPPFQGTSGSMRNPPFISLYSSDPASVTPTITLNDGLPPLIAADPTNPVGALNAVTFDAEIPYVHQFNVTVQRELPLQMVVGVSYVGARGKKQFFPNSAPNLNAPTPGDPRTVVQRRPYAAVLPNVTGLAAYGNWADTRYNALQLMAERRFSNGFGTVANYVLAHAEDNFEYRPTVEGPEFPWADSSLDVRHRFTLTVNYRVPFAQNATGLLGAVARGWQLNVIGQAQTSTPFTVTNIADISGTGIGQDRPDLIGDPTLPGDQRSISRWFNTAAFALQAVGTYGSLERNTMRGPNMVRVDLSASKTFRVTPGLDLQFTAQAFNVFNRANFGIPNGSLGSPAFGTISSVGSPRQMQLAAKLMF